MASSASNGITFVVTHVNADGSTAYQDQATARFDRGNLVVTGTSGAPVAASSSALSLKTPGDRTRCR